MFAIILLLCFSPVFGTFLHGQGSAVGVPISVPVPVSLPVAVPGPVVQAPVAVPAVYSAPLQPYPHTAPLAYGAPQPSLFKYPNPAIKYSLGVPVTTTTTTYSGFTHNSPQFLSKVVPTAYHLTASPSPSFRLHASPLPLPTAFYAAPPQLAYASPSAW
ncbi:uncharacterized protein Dwil_GK26984 [Drosophila willistoni]|uniref:VM domain-containing protein n=1 Tax=Drosophila willistoni TaxID=7260 RepID=A0A0Q9WQ12_DROWI|nr:leucine-rich repeat extensin-like protein 5 [Drosophila willistoni]KRF97791.1 uncharacterized protein Dwil_GK26984 [Drosophila willistoni]